MTLTLVKVFLHDYSTEDAETHSTDGIITDDPVAFVKEETERHGANFRGYMVDKAVPVKMYQNVIGSKDDGR